MKNSIRNLTDYSIKTIYEIKFKYFLRIRGSTPLNWQKLVGTSIVSDFLERPFIIVEPYHFDFNLTDVTTD